MSGGVQFKLADDQGSASRPPILDVKNLSIDFATEEGRFRAVDDVSFSVSPGEIMGLVGESGSGKSVTAKSIMRLNALNAEVQDSSHLGLHLGDKAINIEQLSDSELKIVRGGAVSMIFQEPMASFAPAITLADQIIETMVLHLGIDRKEARQRGIALFDRVGIPEPERRFDQYVFELSGGMRQRAMIAMALSTKPKLLIADEPTTALDVTIQAQVLDLMLELRDEEDMAMIFITHDLGVIAQIADHVAVMQKGRIVEKGDTRAVLTNPSHAYTQRLVRSLPDIRNLPKDTRPSGGSIVEADDVTVAYTSTSGFFRRTKFTAVDRVSVDLPQGHIVGLVGESGSGKTTLGRAMLDAAPISQGRIVHHYERDFEIGHLRGHQTEFRRNAQMIFQDPYGSLNPRMTVRDIIAEPLEAMGLTKTKEETDARVCAMAERCQLDVAHLRRFPHAFSGGQRQRISIARALVCEPKFVVADEAVAALDVSIQGEILDLMRNLQQEMNLTILFISHDLSVIANLCDSIIVMQNGKIVETGSVRDIFLSPKETYTRNLIAAVPTLEKAFGAGSATTSAIVA